MDTTLNNFLTITRSAVFICSLCIMSKPMSVFAQYDLEGQIDGSVVLEEVIVNFSDMSFDENPSNGIFWDRELIVPDTEYIRVHLNNVQVGLVPFEMRLYDSRYQLVETITSELFSEKNDYWSISIRGNFAYIQVFAEAKPELSFEIDTLAYQARGAVSESITIPDNREHVATLLAQDEIVRLAESAVAKLSYIVDSTPYVCTGFLIATDRLMTNEHCIKDAETCRTTIAIFNYQYDLAGTLNRGEQYRCTRLVDVNYDLDYAIIELAGDPGLVWGNLTLSPNRPAENEILRVIGHPAGQPKQVSRIDCAVLESPSDGRGANTDFAHGCDTLGGSSGSPIIDSDGLVVGLHHFGFGQQAYWAQNRAVLSERIHIAN